LLPAPITEVKRATSPRGADPGTPAPGVSGTDVSTFPLRSGLDRPIASLKH